MTASAATDSGVPRAIASSAPTASISALICSSWGGMIWTPSEP